jgi:hypothetical protein
MMLFPLWRANLAQAIFYGIMLLELSKFQEIKSVPGLYLQ